MLLEHGHAVQIFLLLHFGLDLLDNRLEVGDVLIKTRVSVAILKDPGRENRRRQPADGGEAGVRGQPIARTSEGFVHSSRGRSLC